MEQSQSYPRTMRLGGKVEFQRVFDGRRRSSSGPLLAYVAPNDLPYPRLGISMSRRIGIAAKRNRIKRMLREAFRLQRQVLPAGWDLVIVPRPHDPIPLARYEHHLCDLAKRLCRSLP